MVNKSSCRVVVYSRGAVEVMNSPECQAILMEHGQPIRDACGLNGYVVDVQPGKTRAHCLVKTTDWASMWDNAKHNTILKSMDAGR